MYLKAPEQSTPCQKLVFDTFNSGAPYIFVTGTAGVGKSYAVQRIIWQIPRKKRLVVAPTGVAAQLIGGKTIHSAFNINFNLPEDEQVIAALSDDELIKTFEGLYLLVIDEISMVPGPLLSVMEEIAREIRGGDKPWGGLRVIAMGDFRQLPPVSKNGRVWAFESEAWKATNFKPVLLQTQVRSSDPSYTNILNQIRVGRLTPEVKEFLDSRVRPEASDECIHLYSHNESVEKRNLECLRSLRGPTYSFTTRYLRGSEDLVRKCYPWLGRNIDLKRGARVMIRKNDPNGDYVNGSIGNVAFVTNDWIAVDLTNGKRVEVSAAEFSVSDEAGFIYAQAENFPLSLAYATSIHKSQGATLESAYLDISRAWEPGQAYVALSRVKSSQGVFLKSWAEEAITRLDPKVTRFHRELFKSAVKTS